MIGYGRDIDGNRETLRDPTVSTPDSAVSQSSNASIIAWSDLVFLVVPMPTKVMQLRCNNKRIDYICNIIAKTNYPNAINLP